MNVLKVSLSVLLVVASLFLFSSPGYTQELEQDKGKVTNLEKGEEAPFEGILFSPRAFAQIISQKELEKEKKILELEKEFEKEKTKHRLEKEALEDKLELQKKNANRREKKDQRYINTLEQKLQKEKNMTFVDFAVGFVAGGVLVYGSVKLANELE